MNTSTKLTWSRRDQAALDDLQKRKQTARMPVHAVITRIRAALGAVYGPDQMVDEFINHADAIRDALAPFNSGIRVADDSTSG